MAIETRSKRPRNVNGRDTSVLVVIAKAGSLHTIDALLDGKALFDLPKVFVALRNVTLRDQHMWIRLVPTSPSQQRQHGLSHDQRFLVFLYIR